MLVTAKEIMIGILPRGVAAIVAGLPPVRNLVKKNITVQIFQ